jgi:transketolase
VIDRNRYADPQVSRGAYVLADTASTAPAGEEPDVILIGTGSEVGLCLEAHEQLRKDGLRSRVVSMPSWELFEAQTQAYRDNVLPPSVRARVVVEKGAPMGWERYAYASGDIIGVESFGASAPAQDVDRRFGFTVEAVVEAARAQAERNG